LIFFKICLPVKGTIWFELLKRRVKKFEQRGREPRDWVVFGEWCREMLLKGKNTRAVLEFNYAKSSSGTEVGRFGVLFGDRKEPRE